MNWNTVLGVLSTVAFLIPVGVIIHKRLFKCTSLLILMVYYLLSVTYNLMTQGAIQVGAHFKQTVGIFINYLDAPLMLIALLFFCHTPAKKKMVRITWL